MAERLEDSVDCVLPSLHASGAGNGTKIDKTMDNTTIKLKRTLLLVDVDFVTLMEKRRNKKKTKILNTNLPIASTPNSFSAALTITVEDEGLVKEY